VLPQTRQITWSAMGLGAAAAVKSAHQHRNLSAPHTSVGVAQQMSFYADLDEQMAEFQEEEVTYARWSDQPHFVIVIAVAIILNGVQMGLELQFRDDAWKGVWKIFENLFTALFLGEMLIKWWKDSVPDYFSLKANYLDCLIVISSIVDNWFLPMIMTDDQKDKLFFISLV